jgi:ubiquinone/menaquinone biosynthesis C-methylase UbiE
MSDQTQVKKHNPWVPFKKYGKIYTAKYGTFGKYNPSATEEERKARQKVAQAGVDEYYVIATWSYERGWGEMFHYTPFAPGESIREAMTFGLHRLAHLMGLKPSMKVLDLGCGIGAPAREIAKFIGCEIIGINISQLHVNRAIHLTLEHGLSHLCTFIQGDYMDLPFPDEYFDAAYAIQALCHAPSLPPAYAGINRVLKKDAPFAISEWVMKGPYDPMNEQHTAIRNRIECGNALSNLLHIDDCRNAMKQTNFKIYYDEDYANHWDHLSNPPPFDPADKSVKTFSPIQIPTRDGTSTYLAPPPQSPYPEIKSTPDAPIPPVPRPWWFPLAGQVHLATTKDDKAKVKRLSHFVRNILKFYVWTLVTLRIHPKIHMDQLKVMEYCVDGVKEGGETGIFSAMWWLISKKVGDPPTELLDHEWKDGGMKSPEAKQGEE